MAEVTIDLLKKLLVENCMIKVDPETIQADTPLFGPESIGLDSLDALQMAIAVEKQYGLAIGDPATARDALQSLGVLHGWITQRLAAQAS
ncbi:MAG: phosphopantetheine-binding protein [Verrucomicrobia bacterium]|nr:phosphopantetheine-binding protein [Verrucomicrobiota bacterium]MDA1203842.1 phosphopantetheine-binding protein [Verrucomicrobiota bacterium]